MADTLYIKDGSVEVLLREDSFERILRDRLGNEVADYYVGKIDELEYGCVSDIDELKDELDDCKSDLESNRDCYSDLLYMLEKSDEELNKKDINKEELQRILSNMKDKIYYQM